MGKVTKQQQAARIVKDFYQNAKDAGLITQYPRDIKHLIAIQLEIPFIELENLTLHSAQKYLCVLQGTEPKSLDKIQNRTILGLLHVGPPTNIIIVKKDLPVHIANYVIAHELGHYLADVLLIEQRWIRALPQHQAEIKQLFSWEKPQEWLDLQSFIKGLPKRPETITGRGTYLLEETNEREIMADLIARELIAPWEEISNFLANDKEMGRDNFIAILYSKFGLPKRVALAYYNELLISLNPQPDFFERIFSPLLQKPRPKQNDFQK